MVLETILSSPHHRKSPSFRKHELGSCSTLLQRHRFLLTALLLLGFLCTIYLYFAVTLGGGEGDNSTCSGLSGSQKAICKLQMAKDSVSNGKLKFF